jgi:hypothetical protein
MNKFFTKIILLFTVFFSLAFVARAQNTVVSGTVTDARSHSPLAYVTVAFLNSTVGTSTDAEGKFKLSTSGSFTMLKVSFIGYKNITRAVEPGKTQELNFALVEDTKVLSEVIIKSDKKKRYTNKNNPAVELIRKVIEHKKQNQLENYDYAEYKQYERMRFSLSDLSEQFKQKRFFKNYQFLFSKQDSILIGGKNILPFYMEEKLSTNYFRKKPYVKKQVVEGDKHVQFDENFIDNKGLSSYFNRMYQDINIYDNNISLLTNQLLSPIADHSPDYYKFFITDTLKDQTPNLIELSFTPRYTTDLLFEGRIYITMDGNYAVQKAFLTVNKNINLNFVRQMQANLSFEKNVDNRYYLNQSDLKMDFGINKNKGGGILGERMVIINDLLVNTPRPDSIYTGPAQVYAANATDRDDDFWKKNRMDTVNAEVSNIYKNIDSLQTIPSFKRLMDISTLVLAGYKNFGKFELGPANTFYSFNPVEGFRLRVGGRTTPALSNRYYFETYGAYGFKDQKWKYFLSATYSLNDKSIYKFPQSYLRASFQHDTKIPGQELQFVQEDNFLLSFKRGENNLWLYNDIFRFDYVQEFANHLSYKIGYKKWNQSAAGDLYFQDLNADGTANNVDKIHTTEVSAELRYAPHERFYQGKLYRTPIVDKYPIYTLRYTQGIKGVIGGKYRYENITGNISKRFYLSQLGYADVSTEGSYLKGKVPFPLLDIARANQSYAFQFQSYNMMNFQEFVSDHYAAINIDQHFNGFFFNKIPLLKKLKLREIINYKVLWGGLRDQNDPDKHPELLRFPVVNGRPITYTLNNGPYMEGSVGVGNIFKLIRLDLVRRFSYLDHPDAPKWGLRTFVKFDF